MKKDYLFWFYPTVYLGLLIMALHWDSHNIRTVSDTEIITGIDSSLTEINLTGKVNGNMIPESDQGMGLPGRTLPDEEFYPLRNTLAWFELNVPQINRYRFPNGQNFILNRESFFIIPFIPADSDGHLLIGIHCPGSNQFPGSPFTTAGFKTAHP